jgi:ABC-2 type transport system permease protein
MNTMKWLLRREYWENKGAFFWAPLVIGLVMLAFIGGTAGYALATHGLGDSVTVNGHHMSRTDMLNAMPLATRAQIAGVVANVWLAAAAPLFGVLPVVVFFYCLAALYDDRRDRSILFWKSLPVSDQQTVLSKVLTAVCVAPMITIAIGTGISLLMVLIGLTAVSFNGLHLFGLVLGNSDFYLAPLRLVGLLPVYMLWAIPTVGWLLMVSAWARSKVFLWAVGVPVLLAVLAKWANFILGEYMNGGFDVKWFVNNVIARGLAGVVPGAWLSFSKIQPAALVSGAEQSVNAGSIFTQSWLTLLQPDVWIGVVIGGAMIFAAVRLRRWREEG